jgi:anti-sigma regulatory factor (Ser/Thr protein kinase)
MGGRDDCHQRSSGARRTRIGGPPAPLPGTRWRRAFPGEVHQLSLVRRWLESLLPDCPARDDVACVATELGTNAVRHTASGQGGQFVLEVTWQGSAVRVAVEDSGASYAPQVNDDPAGEQGRGLLVVQGLSERFEVSGDHRVSGRTVWAEISWGDAGAAKPASPQEPYDTVIRDGLADLASRFAGFRRGSAAPRCIGAGLRPSAVARPSHAAARRTHPTGCLTMASLRPRVVAAAHRCCCRGAR